MNASTIRSSFSVIPSAVVSNASRSRFSSSILLFSFPLWFLNLPTWAFFLLVILFQFVPMLCPIAWVVGLFFVIKAPQTTLSLVYYVLFALIVLKTFIGVFKSR